MLLLHTLYPHPIGVWHKPVVVVVVYKKNFFFKLLYSTTLLPGVGGVPHTSDAVLGMVGRVYVIKVYIRRFCCKLL